ncbi:hypothetical protein Slin15195_G081220 [Septoria linicola]|uniref:Uncharacterized protein n=1 Tax=Septoria linicola TaxID=215465 RepID=A0A9Q9AX47_9PEZI|nr:hypothetical protein Slin14017_G042430 [Septoria linicola]USW54803.1 hypothetical protein Slin15195_G081220 [Septoria linicola]
MSLARAFTTRRDKESAFNPHIGRAASQRNGRPIKRSQISSPVALISTTNNMSYDAPDIVGTTPIHVRNITGVSTTSSTGDESDAPSLSFDGTDASSIDESPTTPEANHLSCYFRPAVDTKTGNQSPSISTRSSFDAPSIPQRVPSHSKKAHEFVHRKRSVQRLMSPPVSMARRDSTEFFGNWSQPVEAPKENPFGNELAQLDAVAEEMSHVVRDAEVEEDQYLMQARDLAYYGADDYMSEITSLVYDFLAEEPVWI